MLYHFSPKLRDPAALARGITEQTTVRIDESFQTAVDALEVADAVRPATSANAGLTLATARPPGHCNSLC